MGLLSDLSGSTGSSINRSVNSASSQSQARTYGTEATSAARVAADYANQQAMANWERAANFNSDEAAAQRAWIERMSNTVYQRTVKDMQAAGINPVLAANMGLGTASIGGGASASMSDASSYMPNTYADYISSASSESNGSSYGSSHSESGLATGLGLIASAITGLIGSMNSGNQISIAIDGLKNWTNDYNQEMDDAIKKAEESGNKTTATFLKNHKKETSGNWLLETMNKLQSMATGVSPGQIDLEAPKKNAKNKKG